MTSGIGNSLPVRTPTDRTEPLGSEHAPERGEVRAPKTPEAVPSTPADRTRLTDASKLPSRLAAFVERSPFAAYLDGWARGRPLDPSEVSTALFSLETSDLTQGDRVALRKHLLKQLPSERKGLHKTEAATCGRPQARHIVQLMLPWTPEQGKELAQVASLSDAREQLTDLKARARAAIDDLEHRSDWTDRDPFFDRVREDAARRLAHLQPRIDEQQAIVDGFAAWPTERFAAEIERFRTEGWAVEPERAGELLYGLRRLNLGTEELRALQDALLEGVSEDRWPPETEASPTAESLFGLMMGTGTADLKELAAVPSTPELEAIQKSLIDLPVRLLQDPLTRVNATGRGVEPEGAAVLAYTLKALKMEPEQLDRLKAALIEHLPEPAEDSGITRAQVEAKVREANDAESLVRAFTGELLGRAPLPLDRRKLTDLIAETQGERGRATLQRVMLLDGRTSDSLTEDEAKRLGDLDRSIRALSSRLDELKDARRGVNDVNGRRWLDQLEVDVLVGGAVGVPGVFSGSVMGGVQVDEADPTTGRREMGVAGYAMPAMSVGGYGKLDVRYDRAEGLGISGGGGADFLGIWGGPGGKSWGNVFAGGIWVPQVINVGAGYGVDDGRAYGALILGTFWPPFSTASGRVDAVVRHPGLAVGAEVAAEMVRNLSESALVSGGKELFSRAAEWLGQGLRPVIEPVTDTVREARFRVKADSAARGLPKDAGDRFIDCLRVMQGPSERTRPAAGQDAEGLAASHQDDVKRMLPDLQAVAANHPEHLEAQLLLSAAHHLVGQGDAALEAAERGIRVADGRSDRKATEQTRENYVGLALSHGKHAEAWPVLQDWLAESPGLRPRLHLVTWLAGQGREQEAKQLAEALVYENPRSFEAQRALAAVTGTAPTAQVST
ncbi:MAG TPA: hypothetical protein RMG48_20100 [Myxococcales bacterium LLY-WYZ-16_1]|nr:hypothetical protein [Myxococcales bacterium LLY-WYZ-16_1]